MPLHTILLMLLLSMSSNNAILVLSFDCNCVLYIMDCTYIRCAQMFSLAFFVMVALKRNEEDLYELDGWFFMFVPSLFTLKNKLFF